MKNLSRIFFLTLGWFLFLEWFLESENLFWWGIFVSLLIVLGFYKSVLPKAFLIGIFLWLVLHLVTLNYFHLQSLVILGSLGLLFLLNTLSNKNLDAWQILSLVSVFLGASLFWFLIMIQAVSFFWGFLSIILFGFLNFWQFLLVSFQFGEFIGSSRQYLFLISAGVSLALAELAWIISFLPFSFFVLGGIFSIFWAFCLDVFKEYLKQRTESLKKVIYRDLIGVLVFLLALFLFTPWLPRH